MIRRYAVLDFRSGTIDIPPITSMIQSSLTDRLEQTQTILAVTTADLLRAQEAVKKPFGSTDLSGVLWKFGGDLKALNANLKDISEAPDGAIPESFIQSHIPEVRKLLQSIEDLISRAKRNGLMNDSRTLVPLEMIRSRGEYIADYLEALEMSMHPEVLKSIDEGRGQMERGEFEVMDRLY